MEAIYRLNTRELGNDFVNSVKVAYPELDIEIIVHEQEPSYPDETEYLMSRPATREQIDRSIREAEEGKLITFEWEEFLEYSNKLVTDKEAAKKMAADKRAAAKKCS